MEILNQNQRRSAIWRIVALGTFILAMVVTSLYSIHNQYDSFGQEDIEEVKKKFSDQKLVWEGTKNGLDNTIKRLKAELKDCKENTDQGKLLEICEGRIKQKDDDIQKLNADLTRCETKLIAATSY